MSFHRKHDASHRSQVRTSENAVEANFASTAFSEVDSDGGPLATRVLFTTSALSTMRAAMRAGSPVGRARAANADQYPGHHRDDAGELEDGGKSGVRDEHVEEARHDL